MNFPDALPAVAAAMVMAGCATTTSKSPAPVVTMATVGIVSSCDPGDIAEPVFAVDQLPLGSGVDVQMAALRADRKQRQSYEGELKAAITACRKPVEKNAATPQKAQK